ncbi:MAG: GspH/FimT family pseudopilin [Rhodocyclaceae bacterium]|nr:GspH/FimT family pseudopilin [Rhodocyclaceae bacterium]
MPRSNGFTLIELMIVLAVMAILYSLAAPMMVRWMGDARIRVAAETMQTGILLARTEAIRRNVPVRFQLMSSLDNDCAPSNVATHWVVSLDDASTKCATAPSATADPRIVQIKSGQEGGSRVTIAATRAGGVPATTIIYNGTGRLSGATSIDTIDIGSPDGEGCQHLGGDARCLRIRILPGGDSRMCDPKVADVNDVRRCP